jgi:quercetin dioxygenase-like cupin family protein
MPEKEKGDIYSQVLCLKDLSGYQKDSVVSRALANKKNGTVTIFAFDEGQALSEHTASFDAFILMIEGEAEVVISGIAHKIGEGEMIVMPSGKPHSVKALKKFKMLLIMIKE